MNRCTSSICIFHASGFRLQGMPTPRIPKYKHAKFCCFTVMLYVALNTCKGYTFEIYNIVKSCLNTFTNHISFSWLGYWYIFSLTHSKTSQTNSKTAALRYDYILTFTYHSSSGYFTELQYYHIMSLIHS